MSNPTQYSTQPQPPLHMPMNAPVPSKPKPKFNWKMALIVFAAVLIGGVIGSASNPAPPPVIQVQEKTVEKEVMVKQTPISCLTALDLTEEAFGAMSESLGHILNEDYTAANRVTESIKAKAPEANAAKAKCRANE